VQYSESASEPGWRHGAWPEMGAKTDSEKQKKHSASATRDFPASPPAAPAGAAHAHDDISKD